MTSLTPVTPVQNYRTLRGHESSARALAQASAEKREGIRLARHIPSEIIRLIRQARLEMQYLRKRAITAEKQLHRAERRIYKLEDKEIKLKDKIKTLREKLDYLVKMFFRIGEKKELSSKS